MAQVYLVPRSRTMAQAYLLPDPKQAHTSRQQPYFSLQLFIFDQTPEAMPLVTQWHRSPPARQIIYTTKPLFHPKQMMKTTPWSPTKTSTQHPKGRNQSPQGRHHKKRLNYRHHYPTIKRLYNAAGESKIVLTEEWRAIQILYKQWRNKLVRASKIH